MEARHVAIKNKRDTNPDLFREKKYRFDEAVSLGRTEKQAEKEVQDWIESLNENTTQTPDGKTDTKTEN